MQIEDSRSCHLWVMCFPVISCFFHMFNWWILSYNLVQPLLWKLLFLLFQIIYSFSSVFVINRYKTCRCLDFNIICFINIFSHFAVFYYYVRFLWNWCLTLLIDLCFSSYHTCFFSLKFDLDTRKCLQFSHPIYLGVDIILVVLWNRDNKPKKKTQELFLLYFYPSWQYQLQGILTLNPSFRIKLASL